MDDVTARSAQQFGRRAAQYVHSSPHATGDSLGLLRRWLAEPAAGLVLDVATGAGHAALAASDVVGRVVAYDLTAEMLQETRQLAGQRQVSRLNLVQGLAEQMPFCSAAFDAVICRVAAHHFASVERFLAEARRVTTPGGRVILIDTSSPDDEAVAAWQNEVERVRDPSHVRDRSPGEWQRTFAAAGLIPARHEVQVSHHAFRDWVRRAATPPDAVTWLEREFAIASEPVRTAFAITAQDDGDYAFQWPVACVEGYVPSDR